MKKCPVYPVEKDCENRYTESMSLLQISNASYSYPQAKRTALNSINLSVEAGDYIALLGSNGSGKSTLARMMAGFFKPDSGTVKLDRDVLPGIVFQNPKEQVVAGIVERDTAFGPQNLRLSKSEIELRTIECLSVIGLADRASSRTFELSLGQTQRVAFSGILALFPDLLILDEVTAMLDPGARDEIIQFVNQWNLRGHAIIHVTHDEDEALQAKRVVVLDKGNIIFNGSSQEFRSNEEIRSKVFGYPLKVEKKLHSDNGEITLKAENISFSYPDREVFKNVSFNLKKGTLTALTGPSGCGKSTMFECIAGLLELKEGSIHASCRPALSLQESEAALFEKLAADDVAFGAINEGFKGKELVQLVKKSMTMAGLDFNEFKDRQTFALSGGEKRKLSIAGIIALGRDIMIFDEPTSALDPGARQTVLKTLRTLADEGKTVLFSTHRMEEADIADVRLKWEDLLAQGSSAAEENPAASFTEEEQSEKKEEELKKQGFIPNAKILRALKKTTAGFMAPHYIPPSPVSKLPAVLKFLLFLALLGGIMFVKNVAQCGIVFGIVLLYTILSRYPLGKPLKAVGTLLPWIGIFMLFEFVFFPSTQGQILFEWKWFSITTYKLELLGKTFIRAFSMIFTVSTFIFSTSEREILDGLADLLKPLALIKIPVHYLVLVVGIIFRFVPLLLEEMCGIIKTQIVRGAFSRVKGLGKFKIIISLTVPVILQTFRKAQTLSDALTARYFS